MSYINENFLLENDISKAIYSKINDLPIFDYHCHLNEKEILEDKPFEDIFEITLKYDHYKWRLMRFAGVSEDYITGNKSPKEKFIKYCEVLGDAIGNPLYHWTQLELEKYCNCTLEINKNNAEKIWDECNSYIKNNCLSPVKLIKSSNVKYICTTNKMFDDLTIFDSLNGSNLGFNVYPTFRPDDYLYIEKESFIDLCQKSNITDIASFESFMKNRLDKFVNVGCVVCDLSLAKVSKVSSSKEAEIILKKRLKGETVTKEEIEIYQGFILFDLLKMIDEHNLVTELHLGATRNNNTLMFNKIGPDAGYDAIGEENTIDGLKDLFDKLTLENKLGKIILFNLNQKDNKQLIVLAGSFATEKSQIQFGPAWWFLDNLEGITTQLKDLSSLGHLGSFVGMLTDSRSFVSYERHQYFRRILANYLGTMILKGQISQDIEHVTEIAKNISYYNSVKYFGLK